MGRQIEQADDCTLHLPDKLSPMPPLLLPPVHPQRQPIHPPLSALLYGGTAIVVRTGTCVVQGLARAA